MEGLKPYDLKEWDTVFDVRAKFNQSPYFVPIKEKLHSEWRSTEMFNAVPIVGSLGKIPGQQIRLCTTENVRRAVIHHLMNDATPEFEAKVRAAISHEQNGNLKYGIYQPDIKRDLNDPDEYATWLYWLKRLMDTGSIYQVKGNPLPNYERIRSMGTVRSAALDMGLSTKPGYEDQDKYSVSHLQKRPEPVEAVPFKGK